MLFFITFNIEENIYKLFTKEMVSFTDGRKEIGGGKVGNEEKGIRARGKKEKHFKAFSEAYVLTFVSNFITKNKNFSSFFRSPSYYRVGGRRRKEKESKETLCILG